MTDTNTKPPAAFDFDTCQAQERERLRLMTELWPANQPALFDALACRH